MVTLIACGNVVIRDQDAKALCLGSVSSHFINSAVGAVVKYKGILARAKLFRYKVP